MVLSKKELLQYINEGKIGFTPGVDAFQLQPISIDLRIGSSFYVPESWRYEGEGRRAIEPDYLNKNFGKDNFRLIKIKPGQFFEVMPGELILASSLEKVEFKSNNLMAVLYPRSSMVRRGFVIQGGVVDVGYKGHLVIPVLNASKHSLKLYTGERAYQLLFHLTSSELSEQDIKQHGVIAAKYADSAAYNLEARTDSDDELEYIKNGDLEGLKKKFPARS